mgnify:CR=1 FL=1
MRSFLHCCDRFLGSANIASASFVLVRFFPFTLKIFFMSFRLSVVIVAFVRSLGFYLYPGLWLHLEILYYFTIFLATILDSETMSLFSVFRICPRSVPSILFFIVP